MNSVFVVGIGICRETVTPEAKAAIDGAKIVIGSPRALKIGAEASDIGDKTVYSCVNPQMFADIVKRHGEDSVAILVSGDVGFYSAARRMPELLPERDIKFVPGVSSAVAMFAKVKEPWQEAVFVSAHGRDADIVSAVRRNRLTLCLAADKAGKIGEELRRVGFGSVKTYVGIDLGAKSEHIAETRADTLYRYSYSCMTVLLFVNEDFDDGVNFGLDDGDFSRLPNVPMTKSEVRSVIMSKLKIRPASVCWDIGSGTGSVTVEMALAAYKGRVYAVDRDETARGLTRLNCDSFRVGNVVTVAGEAPAVLCGIKKPDVVFIGGGGSAVMRGAVDTAIGKKSNVRFVISAASFESVTGAVEALTSAGAEPSLVTINAARSKSVGAIRMMSANNPVTLIYGQVRR